MRTNRIAFVTLAACAVALGASARPAQADGSVLLGSQFWTQTAPEAKYQEFVDVPRGPFIQSLTFGDRSGRHSYALSGINLIRGNQAILGSYDWGARFGARLGWIETPHRFSNTTRSMYTEIRPGVFVLPDSLQALTQRSSSSGITNALTDAVHNGHSVPLGFSTGTATARLRAHPVRGWTVEVNGRQTTRAGRKAYGALIGTSPGNPSMELWEPIDQTLTDADLRASYARGRLSLQAIGGVSLFDNKNDRMTWDNARRLTDLASGTGAGPAMGQLALAPDNREIRGSVAVGVRLPRRSLFTGTVGVAQITQNQDWLPISVNQSLRPDTIPLPGRNTDGKANVVNLDGRLTTMALDRVRGTLRFHSDRYDNQTPVRTFSHIVNGDVALAGPEQSTPFGNDNWVAGLDVDATPETRVSVGGTAEYKVRNRTDREVEKDSEAAFGGRLRLRPADGVSIDAKARYGDRKLDHFNEDEILATSGAYVLGPTGRVFYTESPGFRRFDIASRKQTQASGGVSWAALEQVDLAVIVGYLKNDYDESRYGLQKEQQNTISAEGTIHATPRLDLHGGYGFMQIKSNQKSNETSLAAGAGGLDSLFEDPATDWTGAFKDRNVYVFGGFDLEVRPERLTIAGQYEFSRDYSDFDLAAGPRITTFGGDPPSTLYRRHDVTLEARYRLLPSTEVSAQYGFEEFDVIDFATKDVPLVAPSAAAIYLGDFYQDYKAHRVALLVQHRF